MQKFFLAALFGTTALLPVTAMAQATNQEVQAQADCDRLIVLIEQREGQELPVTLEEAEAWRNANDREACIAAIEEVEAVEVAEEGAEADREAGQITVEGTAPNIVVDPANPKVTVTQPDARVAVTQPPPVIIVRQGPPTITVDAPQPEIIVRMPSPDVDVMVPDPKVAVQTPEPDVRVVERDKPQVEVEPAEANVRLMEDASGAQVDYQRAQPEIRYERTGEPRIVYNEPEGEPKIRVEEMSEAETKEAMAAQQQQGAQEQQQAAASQDAAAESTAAAGEDIKVSRLEDLDVINAEGEQIGEVEDVVEIQGREGPTLIISHGGFLGLGEKEIAMPLQDVSLWEDKVLIRGLTDEQIKAMPQWNENAQATELEDNRTAQINVVE